MIHSHGEDGHRRGDLKCQCVKDGKTPPFKPKGTPITTSPVKKKVYAVNWVGMVDRVKPEGGNRPAKKGDLVHIARCETARDQVGGIDRYFAELEFVAPEMATYVVHRLETSKPVFFGQKEVRPELLR